MNWKHIPILVGATILFGAAPAFTQEVALPGRALQKTSMKTQNTFLGLNSTFKDAFTPTNVSCPSTGTCTLHIEVSTQFFGLSSAECLNIRVRVDGADTLPSTGVCVAGVATSINGYGLETRTFQWIKNNVEAGIRTVDVEMSVTGGANPVATATLRVLKINIYKP
jgi:hypothetical protein